MNITITGGSGFLGQKLAHRLLDANALSDSKGNFSKVEHITLLDYKMVLKKKLIIPDLKRLNRHRKI